MQAVVPGLPGSGHPHCRQGRRLSARDGGREPWGTRATYYAQPGHAAGRTSQQGGQLHTTGECAHVGGMWGERREGGRLDHHGGMDPTVDVPACHEAGRLVLPCHA